MPGTPLLFFFFCNSRELLSFVYGERDQQACSLFPVKNAKDPLVFKFSFSEKLFIEYILKNSFCKEFSRFTRVKVKVYACFVASSVSKHSRS